MCIKNQKKYTDFLHLYIKIKKLELVGHGKLMIGLKKASEK
jgi:hypothetical protein